MASVAARPATRHSPSAWSLPRFEGHSATETVRRIIREAIVDGRIPAGDQLRESRLVDMLGTSRGTVREAILVALGSQSEIHNIDFGKVAGLCNHP